MACKTELEKSFLKFLVDLQDPDTLTDSDKSRLENYASGYTKWIVEVTSEVDPDHTHILEDITDVTASASELNLLDLSKLDLGYVLAANSSSSASWRKLLASEIENDLGWGSGSGDVTAGTHSNNYVAVWSSTTKQIEGFDTFVFSDDNQLAVGHSNPSERLDVDGYVIAKGYKIPGGTSSQYLLADGTTTTAGGSVTPGGIAKSIQVHGASGDLEGWDDYLWDDQEKKMQMGQVKLKSVDNTIELYDDLDVHYATMIGSGTIVEKALDFIDPVRFDILVHSTVPSTKATFTLQPDRADALSVIAANDRYLRFRTTTADLANELHQKVELKSVADGDNTMQSLVLDSITGEIKKYTISGGGSPTSLSLGTITATTLAITSDGAVDDVVLPEANTTEAGLLGAAKWNEIVANTSKVSFPGFTSLFSDYGFTDNSSNWDVAFGWGDHSVAGYLTSVAFSDLTDKNSVKQAATNKGNIAGAISFDMTNNHIYATLSGDVTAISFTNEPSATEYKTVIITITQDAVTLRAMDWATSGVHPGTGVTAADLEPQQTLSSITQYYLYWAGHLGYWTIAKEEVDPTAL